ncbi:energy-coupled thiamine transporter ThiT [Oscillospiraceae bacterium HV4-5-C5C]|nr:energy-coupled thiamine transporter ThiT [Oscillospiraceae bacterium HV4-5-C5C]
MSIPISERSTGKNRETLLTLTSGGVCIALATVLSMIKLWQAPMGGSVTPGSMLPLLICGFAFGPVWGCGVGLVYGILQYILDPFPLTVFSFLLDYPLAFGALGLSGFFAAPRPQRLAQRNILRRLGLISFPRLLLGTLVAVLARACFHFLSGFIFYGSYAADYGYSSPVLYSLVYQAQYMLPELVILIVLLFVIKRIFYGQAGRNQPT